MFPLRRILIPAFLGLVVLAACNLLDPNPGPTPLSTVSSAPSAPGVNMKVDTAIGARIFALQCARCPGDSAQGTQQFPKNIQGVTGILKTVRDGSGLMPPFPSLSDSDIKSIELFLSLFHDARRDTMTGATIYHAYCATCHGDSAQGIEGKGHGIIGRTGIDSIVHNGTAQGMPGFPWITTQKVREIEQFLASFSLPQDGPSLYRFFCASCHGDNAQGLSGKGIALQQYKGISNAVKNGTSLMAKVTGITDSQIVKIEAFLATLPLPTNGAGLFSRYCARCHGTDANGIAGNGIPLEQYTNIAPTVKNGTAEMAALPDVTDAQIALIEQYLGTLQLPADGPTLYQRFCASCHGADANGKPGRGIALQQFKGIANAVKNGTAQMPKVENITDAQIAKIEAYLGTLSAPTDGPKLYSRYCAQCHGMNAEGMTGKGIALQQYQGISDAVKNGTALMAAIPDLSDQQIALIEKYLGTFALPTDGAGLYSRYCARCHGGDANGMPGKGIALEQYTPIAPAVKNGTALMPAVTGVTDAQIAKIESYLATLPMPTTGSLLYSRFCARCHGGDANGIPGNGIALQQYKNIAPTVKNGWGKMVPVTGITDAQIALIEQYLGTLTPPSDAVKLFSRFCATCHGESAQGVAGKGIALQQFTGIAIPVKNGTALMPAVSGITDAQIATIEKWLGTLALPSDGSGLYSRFCAQCHGMDANGMTGKGIALQQYKPIANAVKKGTELMAPITRLNDAQIALIETYLGTLTLPDDGAHLYSRFCAQCHGETAQGMTGKGIALQQFTGIAPTVKNGTTLMPAIVGMSDAQIGKIEQFLGTLPLPTTGAGLYSRFCAQCHGMDASGMPGKGIALQQFQGISPAVKNGTATMPAVKQLNDGQISLIEQYLGTLQLPANGAVLYSRFCARCHGADANGMPGNGIALQQFVGISTAVKNGTATMPAVTNITDAQIALVEQYLGTLALPSDGAHLYSRFCAQCHGETAQGMTGKGIGLQQYRGISGAVKNGTATMPAIPKLSDAQIATIEQFLQTIPLPTTGAGLYSRFCAQCHGASAEGITGKGIALQQYHGISGPVKNGTATMPAIPQLNDAQIATIEQYLGTFSLPTTGSGLYARFCAQCHGTDANGMTGKGIALQQYSPISPAVKNGTATMPSIPQLTDPQITLIEQYLGTLQLPANGAVLYSRFCASCHGVDANGIAGKGIALQKYQNISPVVKNGSGAMPAVPKINDAQIALVEQYLGTLQLPADGPHLYSRFCASCHGADANGIAGKGIPLQRYQGISPAVKNGTTLMPAVAIINDAQISLIEQYLGTLQFPTDGPHLYLRFCASCHGSDANGLAGKGIALQQFDNISPAVKNGTATMPAVTQINDVQIASIQSYLSTLPLPTTGGGLYSRFCAQCHGTDAGGMSGKGIALQQYIGISSAVKNGTATMPAIPKLNDGQIALIETYLGTLPLPTTGSGLYSRFCASCHGTDAAGMTGKGIALMQYSPIAPAVTNGTAEMPAIPQLNSGQITLIETYLGTLALPNDGRILYSRFCQSCHGSSAQGNYAKGAIALQQYTGIFNAVRNGTSLMPAVSLITNAQITLVEQYLGTIPLPTDGPGLHSRFCASCHGMDALGRDTVMAIAGYSNIWIPVHNGNASLNDSKYKMQPQTAVTQSQATLIQTFVDTVSMARTGRNIYFRYCIMCHGPHGNSLGDGRNSVNELKSKVRSGSNESDNGMPPMPAYTTAQISDAEMTPLYNYIITLH